MQRWQLTTGLAGLAILGAIVAPTLNAKAPDAPVPPTPTGPAPEVVIPPVAPASTGHLLVAAQLDRSAVLQGQVQERFLAITVRAPSDIGESFRRPVDLGVVMDVSGSMAARGKIDYARSAAKLLATSMEPQDVYSLVTFSDNATVVVPAAHITNPYAVHAAVDRILEGGGTNLYAGLDLGAGEVRRSAAGDHVQRVILLSDGHANVGITDPTAMGRYVSTLASQGVTVSTIGLGLDYNEDVLSHLADLGGGTYDFVDDPRELAGVFSDELERTASVVARGTTVTVDLPEGVELLEVLGWDATRGDSKFSLFMGDIYAGDARKVIARVKVTGSTAASMDIAHVQAAYHDVIDAKQATTLAAATASTTTAPTVVEASIDRQITVEAVRAWGNDVLVGATREYEKGNTAEAAKLAERSGLILRKASVDFDDDTLAKDAEASAGQAYIYDNYAPSSAEGRRAVKQTKEDFATQSRALVE